MAILFSQADGSDQHYDTYEEFEQAFILLKRLNGEKVPQDLLDEVKAKNGDKGTKPIKVEIDGSKIEEAIRKATEQLAEALDECENPETEPKFEVGDKVRVVSADDGTGIPYHGFIIGSTVEVEEVHGNGKIDAYNGNFHQTLLPHHCEKEVIEESSPTEFEHGDLVVIKESFRDSFGDVAETNSILPVVTDKLYSVIGVGTVLIGDNIDKLRLVCRKEDRKDIEL